MSYNVLVSQYILFQKSFTTIGDKSVVEDATLLTRESIYQKHVLTTMSRSYVNKDSLKRRMLKKMILLVIYCVTNFDIFGLDCVNPNGSEHLITGTIKHKIGIYFNVNYDVIFTMLWVNPLFCCTSYLKLMYG